MFTFKETFSQLFYIFKKICLLSWLDLDSWVKNLLYLASVVKFLLHMLVINMIASIYLDTLSSNGFSLLIIYQDKYYFKISLMDL